MSILKYLGIRTDTAPAPGGVSSADADSIRRIVKALDSLDPVRAKKLAAFAFVLSRAAGADLKISETEIREMERLIMERAGLPEEQAVLVVEIARRQNILFGGTDNFLVTRDLKETMSHEEKVELLHCLFAVSAAEDGISATEEGAIAQIASELGFDRREMVQIRSAYRDQRAVFRKPPAV
ncbi:MAG TPA: TerB family tellurite resistance protein [Candidatus Polarisedimenticolia bacterium]|nr:TerB family tellurite resistance protein [Candidatus Polarisedimenticolia bacterium]